MLKFFKKKTDEEKLQHRVDELFLKLICDNDFRFTELEQVQIYNQLGEKIKLYLNDKAVENKSKSIEHEQKANEIFNAKSLLK